MSGGSVSDQTDVRASAANESSLLALWAVGIAAVVTILDVLSGVIFAVAYVGGGSSAVSDNWVGLLGAIALIGGLFASLLAFVFAITVKIWHEKWTWLRLPLIVFPALLAFVALGEMFWWQ